MTGPIKPLERSENAFDPNKNKARTAFDKVMKEARSILNKLTLTNFDKLSNDLAHLDISEPDELRGLVSIIFDKALEEGHFCKMYAELCNCIKDQMKEFQDEVESAFPRLDGGENTKVKKVTFKRCLLNKCQEEFERADRYDEMNDEETMGLDATAKASKTRRVRNRMLGNIKFIGELFAQKILNEKIMHDCVKRLLESKEEDTIECLCKLMATIGKLLDREEARHYMDYYFDQMKQTANEIGSNPAQFPSGVRLKFMILDTIDLRKNRYVLPFVLVLCLASFCWCCFFVPLPCITLTHTPQKNAHTIHTRYPARVFCV
jgi:translation initiation factor 4G